MDSKFYEKPKYIVIKYNFARNKVEVLFNKMQVAKCALGTKYLLQNPTLSAK